MSPLSLPELTVGWAWLQVRHPDPERFQSKATPDVVLFRPGLTPWLTVIDAKYVGRHWVPKAAADIHAKYSRIRVEGVPAVRHVVAVHTHAGLDELWAGYGYVPMIPGDEKPASPPATPDTKPH